MIEKSTDAFRTISEVGEQLDLPQHVLRFWETRFTQIKPMKRNGGRRYYRPADVDLLRGIKHLLYEQGYTIKGVQKLLKDNGVAFVVALGNGDTSAINTIAQKSKPEQFNNDDFFVEKTGDGALNLVIDEDNLTIGNISSSIHNKDSKSLLQESLLELMECKRILDRARVK